MTSPRRILLSLALAALLATPAAARGAWTYVNTRYGFTVTIPGGFVAQRESANGDGRVFDAARGDARILASAGPCTASLTSAPPFSGVARAGSEPMRPSAKRARKSEASRIGPVGAICGA